MSSIQQYQDLLLAIQPYGGSVSTQGLVQNVTISADAGLDFVTYSSGTDAYTNEKTATVSFESLVDGLSDISSNPLFTTKGDIYLTQKHSDSITSSIKVQDCLISSLEYNLTSDSFFIAKYEYTALGITGSPGVGSYGAIPSTGDANYRTFYDMNASTLPVTAHYAVNITFNIERKDLYHKGNPKAQQSVIVFPIETKLSFEIYAPSNFNDSGIFIEGQPLNDDILKYFSKIDGCSATTTSNNLTIAMCGSSMTLYDLYLSSFETQGGGVDGTPLSFKVEYTSHYDYGLVVDGGRVVDYITSAGGGGGGPPPEPE